MLDILADADPALVKLVLLWAIVIGFGAFVITRP
jgi:hypothetical protein